jgi:hypothetical protein
MIFPQSPHLYLFSSLKKVVSSESEEFIFEFDDPELKNRNNHKYYSDDGDAPTILNNNPNHCPDDDGDVAPTRLNDYANDGHLSPTNIDHEPDFDDGYNADLDTYSAAIEINRHKHTHESNSLPKDRRDFWESRIIDDQLNRNDSLDNERTLSTSTERHDSMLDNFYDTCNLQPSETEANYDYNKLLAELHELSQ